MNRSDELLDAQKGDTSTAASASKQIFSGIDLSVMMLNWTNTILSYMIIKYLSALSTCSPTHN